MSISWTNSLSLLPTIQTKTDTLYYTSHQDVTLIFFFKPPNNNTSSLHIYGKIMFLFLDLDLIGSLESIKRSILARIPQKTWNTPKTYAIIINYNKKYF